MFPEQQDPPVVNCAEDLTKPADEEEVEQPKRKPRVKRRLFGRRSGRIVEQSGPLIDRFGGATAPFDTGRHEK